MLSDTSRRTRRVPRAFLAATAAACLAVPLLAGTAASAAPDAHASPTAISPTTGVVDRQDAPRTVITTDPELDDLNSMLRMLLYSDEINIAGLVYSSSQHHYEGDPENGTKPFRWPAVDDTFHIDTAVNAYDKVYPNLVTHDANYPTPDSLRDLITWGNVKTKGDMAEDTDGSNLIKDLLLDDEPGQVFLEAWGGANTIARALKSIQDEYEGSDQWATIHEKVQNKAVITSFGQQDDTFQDYIRPNWPSLEHREVSTSIWGYGARGSALDEWQRYLGPEWMKENISDVGPMGAEYRVWGDGKFMADGFDNEDYFGFSGKTSEELRDEGYMVWTPPQPQGAWISEGDSSNFALLIQNGLRNYEDPSWGGWGGRQEQNPDDTHQWRNSGVKDAGPDGLPRADYSAARWFEDFQLDLAARLQWSVTSDFDDVNHAPESSVREGVDLTLAPGQHARLHGQASDPDGDNVSYDWYQYQEAGTYDGAVEIDGGKNGTATFTVPENAQAGDTLHFILEVADDEGLKAYQRVVVTVSEPVEEATLAVELSTDKTEAGSPVDVSVTGLDVGEEAEIVLHSDPVKLGDASASADGTIEATVTIPDDTEAGDHKIVIDAEQSGTAEATVTITAAGDGGDDGTDDGSGDDHGNGTDNGHDDDTGTENGDGNAPDSGSAADEASNGDASADGLAVTGGNVAWGAGLGGAALLILGAGAYTVSRARRARIE